MKKLAILFGLAVMCCMMTFAANGTKIGNIYYILDDTNLTATVTWGGASESLGTPEYTGSIVIPGSVSYNSEVYQVTSIGESAFESCYELTSVTIPESVTSIGASAFYGDYSLVSANIPLGVTRIEGFTFTACVELDSIVIPGGVTYIGFRAFLNCYALADMYVSATTPPIVDANAFNGMGRGATFLFVPDVDVYKQADGWKEFTNITTSDFKGTAIGEIDAAIVGVTDETILAIATQAKTEIGQTETARQAFAIKNKALADIALLQAKADAIAAIDAAIVGVTDTDILAIATTAKPNINNATTIESVNSIKDKALAKINAFAEIDAAIVGVTDETILAIATQAKTDINAATTVEDVVAIKTLPLAKINAFAEIEAAIEGVTDETILAIATQAKTDINAATTVEDVVAIKTLPLAKINALFLIQTARQGIQNAEINSMIDDQVAAIANATTMEEVTDSNLKAMTIISIFQNGIEEGDAAGYARGKEEGKAAGIVEGDAAGYARGKAEGIEEGKAEALGEMGTECSGCPSIEVTKGDKTIKLYNPEKVEFMKME